MKQQLHILEQFSADELLNELLITRDVRQRIATATNKTITDINSLISSFHQMQIVQKWCYRRLKNKMSLPKNQNEMTLMMIGMYRMTTIIVT